MKKKRGYAIYNIYIIIIFSGRRVTRLAPTGNCIGHEQNLINIPTALDVSKSRRYSFVLRIFFPLYFILYCTIARSLLFVYYCNAV